MKKVTISILVLLMSACAQNSEVATTKPTSTNELSVLGQEPPGLTPELFAPGLVSTRGLQTRAAFSSDMKEFYYFANEEGEQAKNYVIRNQDGTWRKSNIESLAGLGQVFISTDGNRMHLGADYRERTDTGWSEKKSLGPQFDEIPIMRLTASAAGTYFFDERKEIGTIRTSRLIDGVREAPRALGENINSGKYTAHPFIAPDESYLIFDSEREGGYGDNDLYISFRQQDGSWGKAINMGENINTEFEDSNGSVTPDGQYFFFHTINLGENFNESHGNIYWMDAQIIETLRPKP